MHKEYSKGHPRLFNSEKRLLLKIIFASDILRERWTLKLNLVKYILKNGNNKLTPFTIFPKLKHKHHFCIFIYEENELKTNDLFPEKKPTKFPHEAKIYFYCI